MRTLRKFFDAAGQEVPEGSPDAARCHELTMNDQDRVVSESNYRARPVDGKPSPGLESSSDK